LISVGNHLNDSVKLKVTENGDSGIEPLDHTAYVLGSRYRKIAVRELERQPTTPSQIAAYNDVSKPHVSRALKELREKDIVEAHESGSRTKLYTLTELGQQVADLLDQVGSGADS